MSAGLPSDLPGGLHGAAKTHDSAAKRALRQPLFMSIGKLHWKGELPRASDEGELVGSPSIIAVRKRGERVRHSRIALMHPYTSNNHFNRLRVFAPIMIMLGLTLAGCAGSRGGPVAYNRADFVAPDPIASPSLEADHKLQPGDIVTVSVFQVDAVSGDREVDALGRIQMPLIGPVPAQGMTTTELSQALAARLNESYLRNPRVQVVIKSVRQETITVDGSVATPGVYPISGRISLIQAIALARGTSQDANPKRVVVFRRINGTRQAAAFDLSTIRQGTDPDPEIFGDDVIIVDGSRSRQMFRDLLSTVPLFAVFRPF